MTWDKLAGLGYRPERDFEEGLAETVDWCRHNTDRWAPLMRNPQAALPEIRLASDADRSTHRPCLT